VTFLTGKADIDTPLHVVVVHEYVGFLQQIEISDPGQVARLQGPRASSRQSFASGHGPAKKPGICRGDHAALFFRIDDKFTMCGIAGFTGPHNRTALELMTECLRHRGPDAVGYWEGADVSLGMRRLAIIDVATG